jgi:type 2 lantibiotic biosynthesis protein LanM
MAFSPTDKRTLSFLAATIDDRAAAIDRGSLPASAAGPAADALLRAWNQAFSPGDAAAFERRLRWEGLNRDGVAALTTSEAAARMPIAAWTERLDEIVTGAADVVRDLRAGSHVDPASALVPFAEIWEVWVRSARRRLLETTSGDALRGVASSVVDACARQLAVELSRQGELALFEYFKGWQIADSDGDRYRAFIAHSLDDSLRGIVFAYPVLARHLSGLTADWIANTREWLERLRDDRPEIAALFQGGDDPGQVVGVHLALSDPHHGRRRVHAVEFASGLRLVYKPRTVAIERVFGEVVAWLNRDLSLPLRVLRVLDRGTHGWVDYAAHEPQTSADAVARYYRQAGALMCLTWALRARDLHMENVVATAEGPVLIDLEMLLQPVSQSAARVTDAIGEAHASAIVEESSLSTGLLSLVEITAAGDAQDAGGLRGQRRGRLPLPRRVWKDLGAANLHYVDEPMFSAPGGHEVRLDGVLQNPGDFAGDLLAGFSEAYDALIARRAELVAADGVLARFEVCSTRVLPRATNQYAMLSYVLAAPKYQRDGAMRAAAIDVLHRAFSAAAAKPELWEVAVEERRALDRLDVPYFSVRCGHTDATAEGRLVARGYFARSGIAAAAARLSAMSARDHAIQRDLIARALGESVDTVFSTPAPAGSTVDARPSGGVDRPEFLDAAIWIAQELLSRAARTGDSLSWPYRLTADAGRSDHHLYDGSLGPAVFFAALSSVVPDPTWRAAAAAALAPVRDHIRRGGLASGRENIGGLSGLGSMVYALGLASSSLGDPEWRDLAFEAADTIDARIEEDDCLDVVDGAAGAVLALLGLHAASDDERPLAIASKCGRHLLDRAVAIGDGSAWPSADGQRLVGFAHGAAGVVHALARLHAASGDVRYAEAVDRGCQFIAGQFLPTHANFAMGAPQAGAPASGHRVMTAWCHGAPGVALGVASALDIRQKPAILAEFDVALRTTARPDVIQPDHLCCGTLGRAEVLLTLGRRLGRVELEQAGVQLATGVLARAVARRHFRLTGAGSEYRVFDPGFFRGLSGIGYEMLRLSAPGRVPSVAALEPPVGSPSRVQELA